MCFEFLQAAESDLRGLSRDPEASPAFAGEASALLSLQQQVAPALAASRLPVSMDMYNGDTDCVPTWAALKASERDRAGKRS